MASRLSFSSSRSACMIKQTITPTDASVMLSCVMPRCKSAQQRGRAAPQGSEVGSHRYLESFRVPDNFQVCHSHGASSLHFMNEDSVHIFGTSLSCCIAYKARLKQFQPCSNPVWCLVDLYIQNRRVYPDQQLALVLMGMRGESHATVGNKGGGPSGE